MICIQRAFAAILPTSAFPRRQMEGLEIPSVFDFHVDQWTGGMHVELFHKGTWKRWNV